MVTRVMQLADGEELISFDVERRRSTVVDDPRGGALDRRRVLAVTLDQLAGVSSVGPSSYSRSIKRL